MSSSDWEFPPSDAAALYTEAEAADEKKEVVDVDISTPGAQASEWVADFEVEETEADETF